MAPGGETIRAMLEEARDFVIRDGDTIYVTEAPIAQWNKTVGALVGSLLTPAASISQLSNNPLIR